MQLSYWFSGIPLSHRGYARGPIWVNYGDYPSVVQLFVVVESYIGGHLEVYPQLCVGASRVDFGLVILPIYFGSDCRLYPPKDSLRIGVFSCHNI
jgi:hypothetical protein